MSVSSSRVRPRRAIALFAALPVVPLALAAAATPASAANLPIGGPNLPESRSVRVLKPGVSLTTIVRGSGKARASQIATTPNGPWRIRVVTVDPGRAKGRLQTTYGGDVAHPLPVTTTAGWAKALFGTNGGFFSETRSPRYPGDPVGLAIHAGMVMSESTGAAAEQDVLIDATTMRLRMGHFTWSATVRNPGNGASTAVDAVNTELAVPAGCGSLQDPRVCSGPGRIARITPQFTTRTPAGPGAELVLDRRGCIVRSALVRGTAINGSQTTLQATGAATNRLMALAAGGGCLKTDEAVRNSDGEKLAITANTYGLTGRFRLVADGRITAPTTPNSLSARNPRTFIGRTADGTVKVATIDGRSVLSVGATLTEEAAVARSLGLTDAVNLDGGGSTTLVVQGRLANVPSSNGRQRAVSDALVFIPR